jgi:hypothetical protein
MIDLAKSLTVFILGAAAFLYYLAAMHDGATDSQKRKLAKILDGNGDRGAATMFSLFLDGSDRLYGERLISFRALRVSICLTFATWFFFFCAMLANYSFHKGLKTFALNSIFNLYTIALCVTVLFVNFLSTALTRRIVRQAFQNASRWPLLYILTDFFLSCVLFFVLYYAMHYLILTPPVHGPAVLSKGWFDPRVWSKFVHYEIPAGGIFSVFFRPLKDFVPGSLYVSPGTTSVLKYVIPQWMFFYSSLLTSIWLWLYTFGCVALGVLPRFKILKRWIAPGPYENHHAPYKALALIVFKLLLLLTFSVLVAAGAYKVFVRLMT